MSGQEDVHSIIGVCRQAVHFEIECLMTSLRAFISAHAAALVTNIHSSLSPSDRCLLRHILFLSSAVLQETSVNSPPVEADMMGESGGIVAHENAVKCGSYIVEGYA